MKLRESIDPHPLCDVSRASRDDIAIGQAKTHTDHVQCEAIGVQLTYHISRQTQHTVTVTIGQGCELADS